MILSLFVVGVCASPRGAAASEKDESEALIREGLALRRKGDDAGALERFNKAVVIRRSGRVLAQIALAEQALGRWVEAESNLKEALSRSDDVWILKNRPLLETSLGDISAHLGELEVSGNVVGADVQIDGIRRGSLPLTGPLRVVVGSVTLEVRAVDYYPLVRVVTVTSGGRAREVMNLVPSKAPVVASEPHASAQVEVKRGTAVLAESKAEPERGPAWQRPVAIASFGAAVALLAYGGYATYQRETLVEDNRGRCTKAASSMEDPVCEGVRSDLAGYATKQLIGFAGAAAFATAGGVVLWLAPSTSSSADLSNTRIFMRTTF